MDQTLCLLPSSQRLLLLAAFFFYRYCYCIIILSIFNLHIYTYSNVILFVSFFCFIFRYHKCCYSIWSFCVAAAVTAALMRTYSSASRKPAQQKSYCIQINILRKTRKKPRESGAKINRQTNSKQFAIVRDEKNRNFVQNQRRAFFAM